MNAQFYQSTNPTMSQIPSTNRQQHQSQTVVAQPARNSVGSSSSSSAESSSTSIVDENSPPLTRYPNLHPTQPQQAHYPSYNLDANNSSSSSSSSQTGSPLLNAAAILNRINGHNNVNTGDGSLPLKKRRPVPVEHKDSSYWEKRRKNNESAKRSRDSKREKETQMSVRISYLERENFELKTRCACLIQENEKLTSMLIAAQNAAANSTS